MALSLTKPKDSLRVRIFAGPNGSGKSTVIQSVKDTTNNGKPIDFGVYVNADDIAKNLRDGTFTFSDYNISTSNKEFSEIALASGLVGEGFDYTRFKDAYSLTVDKIRLKDKTADERLAQIIADFLRKKLLQEQRKFSFETVFSHSSKLDIMRVAVAQGYKVYLYFVSTETPEINKFRVASRKLKGGHDVPAHKIESRYYRSLSLLFEASQIAYQAFYFDNSKNGEHHELFAHFKKNGDKKVWDEINIQSVPLWFQQYYMLKVK